MRASHPLIPTGSFVLSIGIGALITILVQLLAYLVDKHFLFPWAFVLSPIVCGFSASVIFGAGDSGGVGRTVIVGVFAFPSYCAVLAAAEYFIGFGDSSDPSPGLLFLLLTVVPPYFLIGMIMSIIGAVLGRLMFVIGLQR